jgi:molybdopterin molybdotransferase
MGSTPDLLDFEQALRTVSESASGRGCVAEAERVSLPQAQFRILAQPVIADRDQPAFNRSTRDGFAVRAASLLPGMPLQVVGEVKAGDVWRAPDG